MAEQQERIFHKSQHSGGSGSCVEVSEGAITLVRDTQNRALGTVGVGASEWSALIGAVRTK